MSVKLLTSGGGGVVLTPSSSIASDQTMYLPVSGVSGGTVVCSDSSGNVGIGTNAKLNMLTVGGGGTTLENYYSTYLANSYYSNSWKYAGNGVAWGIGNNFGGVSNGVTIAVAASNSGGSGAALTWNPAFNIDTSGNLLVGTTATYGPSGKGICLTTFDDGGHKSSCIDIGHEVSVSSGYGFSRFYYNGSQIGAISQNGTTAVVYNTTSDHRLKTNVRDADAKSFCSIKFRDFEWVDGRHDCGVIAHELQEVYPDLVLGEKDAVNDEGNPVYQQVNYTGLICRMGTVIQQQAKAIESLTERIAALEGDK